MAKYVTVGGGEANVATALARFGCEAAYLSVVPATPIGDRGSPQG